MGAIMKPLSLSRSAVIAASTVLGALSCGGIAYAVTGAVFQYSTPRTGYLSLSPYAFTPANTPSAASYSIGETDLSADSAGCFVSSINLPDGARIKGFTSWTSNSSGTPGSVQVVFLRISDSDDGITNISNASPQPPTAMRTATNGSIAAGSAAVINNQHFAYGVYVCISEATARFYKARIAYTYTTAGD
jgi:hypothetical protein